MGEYTKKIPKNDFTAEIKLKPFKSMKCYSPWKLFDYKGGWGTGAWGWRGGSLHNSIDSSAVPFPHAPKRS